MARTTRSPEERQVLIDQVDKLRSEGKTQAEACKEAGLATGTYITWKSGKKWSDVQKKKHPRKIKSYDLTTRQQHSLPQPQQILQHDSEGEIMVFMVKGKASALGNVIGSALTKLYGG